MSEIANFVYLPHKLHIFGHFISIKFRFVEHIDIGKRVPQPLSKSTQSPNNIIKDTFRYRHMRPVFFFCFNIEFIYSLNYIRHSLSRIDIILLKLLSFMLLVVHSSPGSLVIVIVIVTVIFIGNRKL